MIPSTATLRRKNLFRKAKLAEEAKRYDHMLLFMKEIVATTSPATDLSPKERCLLGAALKNFVNPSRNSLYLAAATTRSWLGPFSRPLAASYLLDSRAEICRACTAIVQLIDRRLLPSATSKESKVFYLTLKGDFSWYMAEAKGPRVGRGDAVIANSAYDDAWAVAVDLDSMNPHRLALEFSIAEHIFKFIRLSAVALDSVNVALNVPAFTAPETRPAVSLLTFEGGLQFTVNLLKLKETLHNLLQSRVAGTSNIPAGNVPSNT